jgi:hypothetical protein
MAATIRYLETAEGGRKRPLWNGGRSQLRIGDSQTSCNIIAINPEASINRTDFLELGRVYVVLIVVDNPVPYQAQMDSLRAIELYEGNTLVALGERLEGDLMRPLPVAAEEFLRRA